MTYTILGQTSSGATFGAVKEIQAEGAKTAMLFQNFAQDDPLWVKQAQAQFGLSVAPASTDESIEGSEDSAYMKSKNQLQSIEVPQLP